MRAGIAAGDVSVMPDKDRTDADAIETVDVSNTGKGQYRLTIRRNGSKAICAGLRTFPPDIKDVPPSKERLDLCQQERESCEPKNKKNGK